MNRNEINQYLSGKFGQEDEEQRRRAQARANENMLAAGMGRAGSTIADAFSGTTSDDSFYDSLEANASDPLDRLDQDQNKKIKIAQYLQSRYDKEDQQALASEDRNRKHEQSLAEMNYQKTRDAKDDAYKQQQLAMQRGKLDQADTSLLVPGLGEALTKEDAKSLKSSTEMKKKFDRQIGEMISLREAKGAEFLDRNAVERGKQLSKDLLLTYKNLAKLGVLSKSDEAIVNQIIPADPLEWNASSLAGQDPTMTRLKSFRADLDEDYKNTIAARLKDGEAVAAQQVQSERPDLYSDKSGNAYADPVASGKIIKMNGKKYRVEADGDTLTEIP